MYNVLWHEYLRLTPERLTELAIRSGSDEKSLQKLLADASLTGTTVLIKVGVPWSRVR